MILGDLMEVKLVLKGAVRHNDGTLGYDSKSFVLKELQLDVRDEGCSPEFAAVCQDEAEVLYINQPFVFQGEPRGSSEEDHKNLQSLSKFELGVPNVRVEVEFRVCCI
ncbi:hypothetical protein NPIL_264111 [Nephila pilipes]|uniref:Uncharacterized protein n=1 Tax=Nephila pilipes TaxID=299642 RepID=A0A8X6MQH6_NEPPI|nr:hypothetical protein NPIL_264111 [Nephila pilipes]